MEGERLRAMPGRGESVRGRDTRPQNPASIRLGEVQRRRDGVQAVDRRLARLNGEYKRGVLSVNAVADRGQRCLDLVTGGFNDQPRLRDRAGLAWRVEYIFLASGARGVVAQEYALAAVPPAHQRGEGTGRGGIITRGLGKQAHRAGRPS